MLITLSPQLNLLSESKRTPRERPKVAPEWWKKLSKNQQENYVKKHPRSYLTDFVKKSDIERKKKAKQETARPKRVSSVHKRTNKAAAPAKRSTKAAKAPAKPQRAAIKEKLRRNHEQKLVDDSLPTVKRAFTESIMNLGTKISHVAKAISDKMSPKSKENLDSYLRARKTGADTKNYEDGRLVANKVLMSIVQVALLAAVVGSVATGTGPLAGALVGAYLGFTSHKAGLEGTKYEHPEEEEEDSEEADPEDLADIEEPDELQSTSALLDEDDPVEELSQSFIEWLGNQDLDGISERIAQFIAIETMDKEEWRPDTAELDDEDIDALMVSESGITPRLTFRVSNNLKRKPEDQRTLYEVVYANRTIGRIRATDALASKAQRTWVAELEDGFNESSYRSGKQDSEPFTLVKAGVVLLKNPTKFTFSECCSWIKHNVDKNFL
ncbi:MAG: hypothetical protein ACRC6V_03595 [Bacteroidales bacterium]